MLSTNPLPTSALDEVEAWMRRVAVGPRPERCGAMAVEHLDSGGKRLRARLALAVCDALAAEPDAAIGWAAACELLHNATLIHDDLQDGDAVRRGGPTCWARHGVAQAVNAGDLLLMLPYVAVSALPVEAEVRCRLHATLAHRAVGVVRGQTADLAMRLEDDVSWASYLRMAEDKTAGLFVLPVEGAALLAGLDPDAAAALAFTFHDLGALFQLQDDVLDLCGDKGRDVPGRDLVAGKVTALVVAHLARRPEDRPKFIAARGQPEAVPALAARIQASGALAEVLDRIDALAHRVETSPRLALYPGLRGVALDAVERALAPIHRMRRETSRNSGCSADSSQPNSTVSTGRIAAPSERIQA